MCIEFMQACACLGRGAPYCGTKRPEQEVWDQHSQQAERLVRLCGMLTTATGLGAIRYAAMARVQVIED